MMTIDPFTAEKLVYFKQSELRAEAECAALRSSLTGHRNRSQHILSLVAIATRLVDSIATKVVRPRLSGAPTGLGLRDPADDGAHGLSAG
jgi:hypothetical protein